MRFIIFFFFLPTECYVFSMRYELEIHARGLPFVDPVVHGTGPGGLVLLGPQLARPGCCGMDAGSHDGVGTVAVLLVFLL